MLIMDNDITVLYDVLLDNQDKSNKEIIRAMEKAISSLTPFDHSEENVRLACNIDLKDKDTSSISSKKLTKVSQEVEAIEKIFTKRECVYMLVGMQKQMENVDKIGKFMDKLKGLIDSSDED